jgi:hypothetical protein
MLSEAPHGERVTLAAIDSIVSLFESGSAGHYGRVADVVGGRGGLSYGKHQAARNPGKLAPLLEAYCAREGARFASEIQNFLQAIRDVPNPIPNVEA